MIARRAMLAGLAATAGLAAAPGRAAAPPRRLFLGARAGAGTYHATAFDAAGGTRFDIALPARAHAFAIHPHRPEAVLFGRRPGAFAAVIDVRRGRTIRTLDAAPGRHFNGHGVYAADGATLFATETDHEADRGVIGVYAVAQRHRRIGELASGGLDPHDIRLLPDGRTLVVANGGILTDPGVPKGKLNVDTMDPSLAYFDAATGAPHGACRPPPALHALSIRHLSVDAAGRVCVAMQYEGPSGAIVPLVALHRPGQDSLALLEAPPAALRAMRNYCGSAALDASGAVLGVSCPRGNVMTFWDVAAGRLLASVPLADGCAIAASGEPGGFVMGSGLGGTMMWTSRNGATAPLPGAFLAAARWDNHFATMRV